MPSSSNDMTSPARKSKKYFAMDAQRARRSRVPIAARGCIFSKCEMSSNEAGLSKQRARPSTRNLTSAAASTPRLRTSSLNCHGGNPTLGGLDTRVPCAGAVAEEHQRPSPPPAQSLCCASAQPVYLLLAVAVLLKRRPSDSGIVVVENGPLVQRGSAMLFLYLTPWIVFRLFMASPLPEVSRPLHSKSSAKVLEPAPAPARLIA